MQSGIAVPTAVYFATVPLIVTVDYCIEAINEAAEGMRKAQSSGVVEYNIGSRGLKRYSFEEMKGFYIFWKNELQDAFLAGVGSSIQTKRAVPCDV
jgi:hypothetical protein